MPTVFATLPALSAAWVAANGGEPKQITFISTGASTPMWSPDGAQLAYVSFENKKPIVFVHSLASGKRHVVANFKGSNSAPAWAPLRLEWLSYQSVVS